MNQLRNGNFTSSEIVALTKEGKASGTFGVPALTYIRQCNMERRLNRSIETEQSARPLTWGKIGEKVAFQLLGLDYTLTSDVTIQHPVFDYWVGSPDGKRMPDTIVDIKCPYTLQSFCDLVDPLYNGLTGMAAMNAIRKGHKDGDKYYWQLVSNGIITGCDKAELIVFMPQVKDLETFRSEAEMADPRNAYSWIFFASDEELPHLVPGGIYQSINKITFDIPAEDIACLTDLVSRGGEKLIPRLTPNQIAA